MITGMSATSSARPRARRARVAVALIASALALTACGGDDGPAPGGDDAASGGDGVTIDGFSFAASPVTAGASFTVDNRDSVAHTVTADDGAFDVRVGGGSTADATAPDEPGTYAFHCEIHPSMTGELVVR